MSKKKFIKGRWYKHKEPGQEKFFIRVEDPEKQICSGWDCKGHPFKNEWVHLGERLMEVPGNLTWADNRLESEFNKLNTNNRKMNKIKQQDYEQFLESEIVANKQLRKDLDEKIQQLILLNASRERSLAITKLEEAIMWLGMDLKRLGTQNPYPSSKNPSTGVIVEPTADGLKFSNHK